MTPRSTATNSYYGRNVNHTETQPQWWGPYQTELQTPAAVQPMIIDRPAPVRPTAAAAGTATDRVDQGRYWVGATLTAAVAALAGVIGLVITTDLLHVPMMGPSIGGGMASHIATYGLITAVIALLAALAYDGMRAFAPRPTLYFTALTALLTALAVLLPFTAGVGIVTAIAFAGVNLVVGLLVMTLVPVASTNARVRV